MEGQTRFCRKCGAKLKEGAKFCGLCGTAVLPKQEAPVAAEETNPPKTRPQKTRAPKVPKGKKAPEKRGVGATIGVVFLCIAIFLFGTLTLGIQNVRQAALSGAVTETLEYFLDYSQLEKVPAQLFLPEADDGQSLADWIEKAIESGYATKDNANKFSDKVLKAFLEESTVPEYLTGEVETYILDLSKQTGESGMTREEIRGQVEGNAELFRSIIGRSLLTEEIDYVVQCIEGSGFLAYTSAATLKEKAPTVYTGVSVALSSWTVIVLAVLTLAFVVLLAKCNKWNVVRTCGEAGVALCIPSGVLMLTTLTSMVLPNLWMSMFGEQVLLAALLRIVLRYNLLAVGVVLGLSVVLIAVKVVWKKTRK